MANSGADIETIKCHGKWKLLDTARGYVEESTEHGKSTTKQLASTTAVPSSHQDTADEVMKIDTIEEKPIEAQMESLCMFNQPKPPPAKTSSRCIPYALLINICTNLQFSFNK